MEKSIAFGVSLGSNLGDRKACLEEGLTQLLALVPGARLVAASSLYETEPVDCAPGCEAFINAVVEVQACVSPTEFHACMKRVEESSGRPALREKNSPRTLDLDLLYAGEHCSDDPVLTLPHPRLHLRRFVLEPLAEIRPDLQLPDRSETVAQLLAGLPATEAAGAVKIGSWRHHLPS